MQIDRPIATALTVVAIILLVYFVVLPEYRTFQSLRTELGEKKAEFTAKYDYYASVTKAYNELLARAEDIKKIDDALPHEQYLAPALYYLQDTAKGNGLMVKDLFLSKMSKIGSASASKTVSGDTSKAAPNDVIFSMSLIGDYKSLGKFIAALEKSSRIFEVTSISFSSSNTNNISSGQPGRQPRTLLQSSQTYNFSLQIKTQTY